MRNIKVEVMVTVWGLLAYVLKLLLWVMIGANLSLLALVIWTTLTIKMLSTFTVIAMVTVGVGMGMANRVDATMRKDFP